jgi:hypothetical protein
MEGRGLRLGGGALLVVAVAGCPGTLDDPGRFAVAAADDAGAADGAIWEAAAEADSAGVDASDCPDVPRVLATTCSAASCHSASNKAQGLDLASPNLSTRLVDVPATEGSGLLIDSSAPSKSVLYLKLTPDPPFGARMPLGSTYLSATTLACVLRWIGLAANGNAPTPVDSPDSSTPDSSSDPPTTSDGGISCQTTMDSYGYTQCACQPGAAVTSGAVAACTGFDCCVRYGPDSGLAEGFGNPSLGSDLCACYSSADIAAILGAPVTCNAFASNGVGKIVSSCP